MVADAFLQILCLDGV